MQEEVDKMRNILAFLSKNGYNNRKTKGGVSMPGSQNPDRRPVNPRRKKRSKLQTFKEVYLPALVAGAVILLILILIISGIARSIRNKKANEAERIAASIAQEEENERLALEQTDLLTRAGILAADYDFRGAIDLLSTFSGDIQDYPQIADKINEYRIEQDSMVAWDLDQVVNLSFQMLMADPEQSFRHSIYGNAFNRNYVTIGEFSKILKQLYNNGYVLVAMDNLVGKQTASDGTVTYQKKALYLPEGKKPVMLTQTNVNYNYYIVDSDGDLLPDKNGAGFANKLVLDENGSIACQWINRNGQTLTGAYDLIPILEAFIAEHPDFSYRGAKATIALTGYNGLFGYRTQSGAAEQFGTDAYNDAVAQATKIAKTLKDNGYVLACYTYDNVAYGEYGSYMLAADVNKWLTEVVPILGSVDTMVFAQNSDLPAYSGDKFATLQNAGFRYYLGFCENGLKFASIDDICVRQGRILVTGSNMEHHSQWFDGLFDTSTVLDYDVRGNIPT